MYLLWCLVFLWVKLFLTGYQCEDRHERSSLELVHVIFRHGYRTNDEFAIYPNDPHSNETYFPYGHGQLTLRGKRQMFALGQDLWHRYHTFLGENYIPSNVEAWSSDTDRTKASLLAVLAGLFPIQWEESLGEVLWQPIPYNHHPASQDKLFNGALTSEFRKVYKEFIFGSPKTLADFHEQKQLFQYLSVNTGWNITNYERIYYLYLCLKTEEEWGLQLPEWTKSVWPKEIEEIVQKQYFSATSTPALRQITSGALLKKIVEDTIAKFAEVRSKKDRKIYLYSGHDFTLAFLLSTLDVLKPHIPPYGSYLIFEVHRIHETPGIRILHQDYQQKEPQVLKLPGCEKFCTFDKFVSIVERYFPLKNAIDKQNVPNNLSIKIQ